MVKHCWAPRQLTDEIIIQLIAPITMTHPAPSMIVHITVKDQSSSEKEKVQVANLYPYSNQFTYHIYICLSLISHKLIRKSQNSSIILKRRHKRLILKQTIVIFQTEWMEYLSLQTLPCEWIIIICSKEITSWMFTQSICMLHQPSS